jgi:hypothetical protein
MSSHAQTLSHMRQKLTHLNPTADGYLLGVPMHNFGLPNQLEAWVDNVLRVGCTFSFIPNHPTGQFYRPLVPLGRRATVIVTSGDAGYEPGDPIWHMNHVEPRQRTTLFSSVSQSFALCIPGTTSSTATSSNDRSRLQHAALSRWRRPQPKSHKNPATTETRSGRLPSRSESEPMNSRKSGARGRILFPDQHRLSPSRREPEQLNHDCRDIRETGGHLAYHRSLRQLRCAHQSCLMRTAAGIIPKSSMLETSENWATDGPVT